MPRTGQRRFTTERNQKIVALLSQGLEATAIGEQIFLSPWTVTTHISRMMKANNAKTKAHLVAIYLREKKIA